MSHATPTWTIHASDHCRGMEDITMKSIEFLNTLLTTMRLRMAGYRKVEVKKGPFVKL